MREAAWRGEGIANRIEARLAYWLWLHLGPTHLFSSLSAHMPTRYPMHPLSFSYFIPFSNFPLITLTLTHPFLPLSVLPPPLLLPPSNPSFFFFFTSRLYLKLFLKIFFKLKKHVLQDSFLRICFESRLLFKNYFEIFWVFFKCVSSNNSKYRK